MAPRTWVHLAGTYDGMNVRLYVNGVEAAFQALTGSFTADTTPPHHWQERQRCHRRAPPGSSPVVSLMLFHRALKRPGIGRIFAGALFTAAPPGVDAGVDEPIEYSTTLRPPLAVTSAASAFITWAAI